MGGNPIFFLLNMRFRIDWRIKYGRKTIYFILALFSWKAKL